MSLSRHTVNTHRFVMKAAYSLSLASIIFLQGCNATVHNELMGVEEVVINGHKVVVTDCYRLGKQTAQTIEDAPDKSIHRFNPCRDADILIKYEELIVNGKSYGMLNRGDRVTLDHHKVLVNGKEAKEATNAEHVSGL